MGELVIGLTGPTGAGKSTVAQAFEKAGCKIIDADLVARQAVTEKGCLSALKAEFGNDIVNDGILDRHLLAQRAFSSEKGAAKLNAITHPVIMGKVKKMIAQNQTDEVKAIVLDAALLFESGADSLCSTTIAVTAPVEIRLNRIMNRDRISKELAKARISAQKENSYYNERARYRLDGAMSRNNIQATVNQLLEQIIGDDV